MQTLRSQPPYRRPRTPIDPLASRLLRPVSAAIDIVLLLTLHFAICASYLGSPSERGELCALVPYALAIVYEIALGTSVGKQLLGLKVHFERPGLLRRAYRAVLKYCCVPFIVFPSVFFTERRQGLHDKAARSVVLQPNGGTAWVRALVGVIVSAYAMLTFGCGTLFSTLLQQKYDPRLASLEPEPWEIRSDVENNGRRVWQQGASVELPAEIDSLPLRGSPFIYFYGRSTGPRLDGPRVTVLMSRDSHAMVELCRDMSPWLKWLFPCGESPREFQAALFRGSAVERGFSLTPRGVLGGSAMGFVKSMLLEGDELLTFRQLDGPEQSIVWYATSRLDDDGNPVSLVDQLEVGGDEPEEHFLVIVLWADCERREEVVESLARSFAFDRGSEEIGANLLEEGRRRHDPLPLLSAVEVSRDSLPAAEELERIYSRRGHGFEKSQFAKWVSYKVESGDLRFMELNERVWDWRTGEETKRRR